MSKAKILGYLLTPVFLFFFLGTLLVFHPFLVITFKLFGYKAHKFVLEIMNICIVNSLRLVGTSFETINPYSLPVGRPLIIVSNHQSMYDIPLLLLNFRKHDPMFISKRELAYGLPSISFALRSMGSAIIDRKDHKSALRVIESFAKKTYELKHSVCIFPEGTRAKDGRMRPFKTGGMITLMQNMPDALVVPVVIAGIWEILRYKFRPVPFGVKVTFEVLQPIEMKGKDIKEVCKQTEEAIQKRLAEIQH
jgi:1-acyl-sn-glycerol-3-phosphate acyltransferase